MRLGRSAAAAVGLAIVVQSAVTEVTYCHARSVSRLQVFSGGQSRLKKQALVWKSRLRSFRAEYKYDLLAGTPLEDIPFKCVHHGTPKGKQLSVEVRKKRPVSQLATGTLGRQCHHRCPKMRQMCLGYKFYHARITTIQDIIAKD